MNFIKQLIEVVGPLVQGGWQGLITLYVVWAVVKQFRTWQEKRERAAQGLEHNPSLEVHEAIEAAIGPLRTELADIARDVSDVAQRVSRIEGRLNL